MRFRAKVPKPGRYSSRYPVGVSTGPQAAGSEPTGSCGGLKLRLPGDWRYIGRVPEGPRGPLGKGCLMFGVGLLVLLAIMGFGGEYLSQLKRPRVNGFNWGWQTW